MPKKKKNGELKQKPGPKPKREDYMRRTILEALEDGLVFDLACDLAGLDRSTGYRWKKDDPEFATQVKLAKAKAIHGLVALTKKQQGGWKILKNLGKKYYQEHINLEVAPRGILEVESEDGEQRDEIEI